MYKTPNFHVSYIILRYICFWFLIFWFIYYFFYFFIKFYTILRLYFPIYLINYLYFLFLFINLYFYEIKKLKIVKLNVKILKVLNYFRELVQYIFNFSPLLFSLFIVKFVFPEIQQRSAGRASEFCAGLRQEQEEGRAEDAPKVSFFSTLFYAMIICARTNMIILSLCSRFYIKAR